MDSFMNLAKQGYAAYESSQENVSKTGGSEYNRPSNTQHDSRGGSPDVDEDYAVKRAAHHSEGTGDESMFSSALGFMKSNSGAKHEPVDEESITSAHKAAYEQGSGSNMSAESMGSAAALQAFKEFASGSGSSGGSSSKSELISMAMSQASKLFDSSGGSASGGKQDVVNSAAMTVMKLVVQSKFSAATGGSNSGGLGGLMSMASKFM